MIMYGQWPSHYITLPEACYMNSLVVFMTYCYFLFIVHTEDRQRGSCNELWMAIKR